jgi:hypothetical protein
MDMNTSGKEVAREPARLDFSLHRAMILTDENNRLLIDEQVQKARRIAQENKLKEIMRYKTYYTNNEFCEERVRKLAKLTDDQTIQNVEKSIFQKITMKHLLGFVKVRDNKNITAPIDHLPSRKDGLVKMAFEVQNLPVIADQATIPALEVNDTLPEEDRLAHVEMPVDTSWSVTGDFVKKSFVVIATLDDDIAENAVAKMESLNDNILSKMLMLRFGVLLRYHKISLNHFTVNFVRKNIERACVILKLHELYPDDELLKYRQVEESLFKIDKKCGDSFVSSLLKWRSVAPDPEFVIRVRRMPSFSTWRVVYMCSSTSKGVVCGILTSPILDSNCILIQKPFLST